jgi:hypothetical protein
VQPEALAVHTGDHVADAAPRVEPSVEQSQLGLAGRHEREADGGAEEGARWSITGAPFFARTAVVKTASANATALPTLCAGLLADELAELI